MDNIFAPWRMQYILSNSEEDKQKETKGCIFCVFPTLDEDEKHLILERGRIAWQGTSAELDARRELWMRYLGV